MTPPPLPSTAVHPALKTGCWRVNELMKNRTENGCTQSHRWSRHLARQSEFENQPAQSVQGGLYVATRSSSSSLLLQPCAHQFPCPTGVAPQESGPMKRGRWLQLSFLVQRLAVAAAVAVVVAVVVVLLRRLLWAGHESLSLIV